MTCIIGFTATSSSIWLLFSIFTLVVSLLRHITYQYSKQLHGNVGDTQTEDLCFSFVP